MTETPPLPRILRLGARRVQNVSWALVAAAVAVAEAAADFLPEPVLRDWSPAMLEKSALAPAPTTASALPTSQML